MYKNLCTIKIKQEMSLQIPQTQDANTDLTDTGIVIKEWSELHDIVGYLVVPIFFFSSISGEPLLNVQITDPVWHIWHH